MSTTKTVDDAYWRDVIDPGDRASRLAKDICFRSHRNSSRVLIVPNQPGNFRGPVGFLWTHDILRKMSNYHVDSGGNVVGWELMEAVENDGAGGKSQFLTFLGEEAAFRSHGWEIITMTRDDFARSGRLAVILDNEMNVRRITDKNFPFFQATMEGYGDALAKAHMVNITGETAIMRHSITAFCDVNDDNQLVLTWGASCIGLCARDKLIDGSRIAPGMPIIGLHEHGYRCNGGTFFTNLILNKWGPDVRDAMQNETVRSFVRKLTVPSISYARLIEDLVGWHGVSWHGQPPDIRGVAHITGGGVWGKFKEILPPGVGADLHSMPEPPVVLREAQELSQGTPYQLSDYQAYGTLHGGCGMLVICAPGSEVHVLNQAGKLGIKASFVGSTIASPVNEVLIGSKFMGGKALSSERPN
ncbi:MAG: AIR synthase-related protein [Patescibacteria group bacterium]